MKKSRRKNEKIISISILLIGVIIAVGIILSRIEFENEAEPVTIQEEVVDIQNIDNSDHILGNPNAKIVIIEYSDFECPYCQQFHPTMKRLMREYGSTGQVAWVYRHFPITEIHPESYQTSLASECVANLDDSDNDLIFWQYVDKIFANNPVQLDLDTLTQQAVELGIDEDEFRSCVTNEDYRDEVDRDMEDVDEILKIDSGFSTPYTLFFTNQGLENRISGAIPYEQLSAIVDEILAD